MRDYDYSSSNYYFITICTYEKKCLFGSVKQLNNAGKIAAEEMHNLSSHYDGLIVDNFIIMPNHVHAIIVIEKQCETQKNLSLSTVVGLYKAGVSRRIKKDTEQNIWQRSFHDHIIRNQKEYEKIWQYVEYNDQKWETDCFYAK